MASANIDFQHDDDGIERDDVVELTKYLDGGVSVELDGGRTLLHRAASCGSTNCMAVLLDRGVDVNTPDITGWTALHSAIINGRIEAANLLLDWNANVNAINSLGRTPLHYAISFGRIDCVQLLLERGADREFVDTNGNKPIHLCAGLDNQETREQLQQLLNGGGQATKAAKPRR